MEPIEHTAQTISFVMGQLFSHQPEPPQPNEQRPAEETITWPRYCEHCGGRGGKQVYTRTARNGWESCERCKGTGRMEPYVFPKRIWQMAQSLHHDKAKIAQKLIELGA